MRISDWSADVCSSDLKRLHLVGGVSGQLLNGLFNTLIVAFTATAVTLGCGLVVAWAGRTLRESARFNPGRTCARIASLGYAVPGTVLAIGLLVPFTWIDRPLGAVFGTQGPLGRAPCRERVGQSV